jgi:hypothetical protein
MKFGIAFANVGPFGQPQPDHLDSLITNAEENGIESLGLADFADRIIAKV